MTGVEIRRECEPMFLVELVYFVPGVVDADCHHLELPVFVCLVNYFHLRHFSDAGSAPCGPEIEKDHLTSEVTQLYQAAVLVFDRKIRRLLTDIDDAWLADSSELFIDEPAGDGTDDNEENDGFNTLAHGVHCSILPAHALTSVSSRSRGTAPWPRTTSWNFRT